jgi:hypothetical protein
MKVLVVGKMFDQMTVENVLSCETKKQSIEHHGLVIYRIPRIACTKVFRVSLEGTNERALQG